MSQPSGNQRFTLPKKESELFKQMVDCYEKTKQYAKGIKFAETILKKFPNHGETQAMKGLILNALNRKEEAFEWVKTGLRNDVRSHVCWHVYGLIYRSDSNYKEASKCYLNALRIEPNNQNILRDLSWLQVQMRDIPGFVETRRKILEGKPTLRASWVAYAVANFISKEYRVAFDIIKKYRESVSDKAELYEESELYLFQNRSLESAGQYDEAITHLQTVKSSIRDKLSMTVKLAQLFVLTGRFQDAKSNWYKLTTQQPDNYRFHCGLQTAYLELDPATSVEMFALKKLELPSTALSLSTSQKNLLKNLYKVSKFKSRIIEKIELTFYDGEEFRSLLDKHLRYCLREGIPAVIHDISSLVRVPEEAVSAIDSSISSVESKFKLVKMKCATDPYDFRSHPITAIAMEMVKDYISNLIKYSSFDSPPNDSQIEKDDVTSPLTTEPPIALLWALHFQCHLHEMSGNYTSAMQSIEECIEHTPTAIDMYCKKARILKKMGDNTLASITMDEARALDLQDRYLNNKSTKYLLRAGKILQAMNTIAMFTKHDGDPEKNLYDLQCSWYELEVADAYARKKQWGLSLKKFYAIRKHFSDYYDDLFDFHGYCIRKTTLRAYMDVFGMHDGVYSHKYFQRALVGVLKIYIHILDFPEDIDGLGHLSAADRKKERSKIKKHKERERKLEEAKGKVTDHENNNSNSSSNDTPLPEVKDEDTDILGEKYLQRDFLVECSQWCGLLNNRLAYCNLESIALIGEVMFRRSKYLQVIRAIRIIFGKDSSNAEGMQLTIKLVQRIKAPVSKKFPAIEPTILDVVKEELNLLFHDDNKLDIVNYTKNYVETIVTMDTPSLLHIIGALKCVNLLQMKSGPSANSTSMISDFVSVTKLFNLLSSQHIWSKGRDISLSNVLDVIEYLSANFPQESALEHFVMQARIHYPLATVLHPTLNDCKDEEDMNHHENGKLTTFHN